jgi:AcrR family transcriptional regulator
VVAAPGDLVPVAVDSKTDRSACSTPIVVQARAVRTRGAILEAAAVIFARRGHEAASLGELVAESGLTKGAFSFHFSSKRALAPATMQHEQAHLIERMAEEVPDTTSGLERLTGLLRARARALEADASRWCVLRLGDELGTWREAAAECARLNEWPVELLAGLVREGQDTGHVRPDLDPRAVGEMVFASTIGMDALALQLTGGADLVERTEPLLDLIRNGLALRA